MPRGDNRDLIKDFIDNIPSEKLEKGGLDVGHNKKIHQDVNLRLDMQSYTTQEPRCYNIQVQVNRACKKTTLKMLSPQSVAGCLAPCDDSWSAQQIRDALKSTVTGGPLDPKTMPRPDGA